MSFNQIVDFFPASYFLSFRFTNCISEKEFNSSSTLSLFLLFLSLDKNLMLLFLLDFLLECPELDKIKEPLKSFWVLYQVSQWHPLGPTMRLRLQNVVVGPVTEVRKPTQVFNLLLNVN